MSKGKVDGFTQKPLCPFCSTEWSDDMVQVMDVYASSGCETCGHGSSVEGTVDITCHACKRLIYRKEGYFKEY